MIEQHSRIVRGVYLSCNTGNSDPNYFFAVTIPPIFILISYASLSYDMFRFSTTLTEPTVDKGFSGELCSLVINIVSHVEVLECLILIPGNCMDNVIRRSRRLIYGGC